MRDVCGSGQRRRWGTTLSGQRNLQRLEEVGMPSEYQISAYPRDLALFVRDRWPVVSAQGCSSLPDLAVLEHLISVCYQASLLQEEGGPVRFRLIFLAPDQFPPDLGPPSGLHR